MRVTVAFSHLHVSPLCIWVCISEREREKMSACSSSLSSSSAAIVTVKHDTEVDADADVDAAVALEPIMRTITANKDPSVIALLDTLRSSLLSSLHVSMDVHVAYHSIIYTTAQCWRALDHHFHTTMSRFVLSTTAATYAWHHQILQLL